MITPRLQCIIDHITNSYITADIGCDHAYVAIKLIEEDKAKKVIASDLNEGPLNIARANIIKYNLSDKIETRLGGGLSKLNNNEADTIIIAGMGGEIIEEIIKQDIEKAKSARLILQPMNSQYELRKFLSSNGFKIISEDLALEGFKVYNIIEAVSGIETVYEKEFDYQIPKSLYNHKYFKNLYDKKMREFLKVTQGLKNSESFDGEKYKIYNYFLEELKKI